MKTLILATVVVLTACATPQTGPPIAGSSHAAAMAEQQSHPCDYPALFDCSSGHPVERPTGLRVSPCDPTVTNPVIYVECPTRKAEADAAMLRRSQQDAANNAMASRYQADALYCKMQAQVASSNVRGFLYPAAVYGQVENTCLQMKAAERGTSNY